MQAELLQLEREEREPRVAEGDKPGTSGKSEPHRRKSSRPRKSVLVAKFGNAVPISQVKEALNAEEEKRDKSFAKVLQQQFQEEDDILQAKQNELRDATDMLVGAVLGAQIAVTPANEQQVSSGTQAGEEKEVTSRNSPGAIGETPEGDKESKK